MIILQNWNFISNRCLKLSRSVSPGVHIYTHKYHGVAHSPTDLLKQNLRRNGLESVCWRWLEHLKSWGNATPQEFVFFQRKPRNFDVSSADWAHANEIKGDQTVHEASVAVVNWWFTCLYPLKRTVNFLRVENISLIESKPPT